MIVKPDIVLVRPKYARNVGFCSRAMANMGGNSLWLIAPDCEMGLEARQGAAGAQQRLMEAQTLSSLDEFLNTVPDGLRIAFSGKPGTEADSLNLTQRLQWIAEHRPDFLQKPIYFIFGPEDDGLLVNEMRQAHYTHTLPIYGEFPSMNISHAVLIALFTFWSTLENQKISNVGVGDVAEPTMRLENTLQTWLETLGFDVEDKKVSAFTVLKRVLLQNLPNKKELSVLSAIIEQTVRRLKG